MPYTVELPDGRTVEFPDSVSREEAAAIIRRQLGVGAQPKESTIGSEFVRGTKQLFSTSRTGIGALASPEEAARAGVERSQQIAAEAGEGPSLAAVRKAYEERGLLPAVGEVVSQIPRAVAGQVPQLAAMAGGAKLGAMAGAGVGSVVPVVGTGLGAIAGGVLGAGATLLPQFFGANVERQAAEQMQRGEPVSIDRGTAAAAAAGQAGIEAAGTALVLGKRAVKGILGVTDDTALATAKAREELVKAAARSRSGAALRGAGVGLAEIPVEVAQAVIERAQAGLDVLSPEALSEYGENAYLAGLVGPTIGAAARVTEPGAAKRKLAVEEQAKEAEARAAAAKAEEERKAQPEYLEGLYTSYQDLLSQKTALDAQIKKGTKEAPLTQEDKDANAVVNRQLNELKKPLEEARKAFIDAGGPQAMQKLRAGRLELAPQPKATPGTDEELEAQQQAQLMRLLEEAQMRGDTEQAAALAEQVRAGEPEAPEAQRTRLTREASGLQTLLEQQRTAMQAAETPEEAAQIAQRAQQTYDALAKANETLGKLPQAPDLDALKKEETKLLKQFDDARAKGDQAAVMQVVPKLLEVRQQIKAAQPDLGLFLPEQIAAEQSRRDTRAQSDTEVAFAREQAIADAVVEQQRQETAYQERIGKLQELRTAPQLGMFPEERETVTQTEKQAAPGKTQLDRQISSVTKQLGDVQRQLDEVQAAPTAIGGPWTDLQGAERTEYGLRFVEDLNKRKQQLESVLGGLRKQKEAKATPPGARVERAPATALAPAQPDLRPQGALAERLNVLAERVLAAPNVNEEAKGLVRQVQDNLPLLLQREQAQPRAEAASVGAWLYRTLQGTAPADLTQDVRDRLAELEAGKRSETELTPTGEVRRAVQTEIEMPATDQAGRPQPQKATAFNDFKEFTDYLASDGLAALRNKAGIVGPTLARLEQFFAPMKAKADAFRADRQRLEALQKSLEGKSAEQKAAAQVLVRDAERRVALARAQMEPLVEKLLALRDLTQQRYSDALTQGVDLAAQLYENTKTFRAQTEAQESMVDESRGAVVPKGAAADALVKVREARAEFEKRLGAWMAAETAKRDLVQANIGQDWGEASPLYQRYAAVKRTTDFARKDLDAARQRLASAQSKLTSFASLPDSVYENFLVKEAELQAQLQQQLRRINGFATNLKKVAKQTPELDAFIAQRDAEHVRVNQQLKSAGSGGVDVTALLKQSQARLQETLTAASDAVGYAGVEGQQAALDNAQAELAVALELQTQVAEEMALTETQARNIEPLAQAKARAANAIERRIQTSQRAAAQRAEARRQTAPAGETQAQREARDAEQRREEQARLERADTGPRTLVEFKRTETTDEALRKFAERLQTAATAQERAAVRKELDEHLKERIVKKEADLDDMKRKAAKNIQDLNAQRKLAAELTERLKGDLTPKRRESAEKQLAEAQRKVSEHQRRYTLNTQEMRVTRTDIQAQRQERNRLLAEASGRRIEGERLGVAEGTQARATGPVTTPEVTPPKALLTGSEESRAGKTATDTRQRLTEARGVQQRDVPIKASEQAEANRIAAELAKQTPEQKAAAAKEEAKVQEEQAKLQAKPAKVKPLKEAAEKRKTKPTRSEVVEDIEEDLYEEPEIEVLGGPEEDVFYSRGKPAKGLTKEEVTEELERALGQKGLLSAQNTVTIVNSAADLKRSLPKAVLRDFPDDAKGLVYNGRAYLIAENIGKDHALGVLLHEVGAHIGFRNFFNNAQYNALAETVKRWGKLKGDSLEARIGRAAKERVEAANTPADQVNDELIAYAVEEAFNAGVEPAGVKSGNAVQNWLRMLVDGFKKALEAFGIAPQKLKVGDLVNMAYGAANLELRGTWHGTGEPFTEFDFGYVGAGEGAQVYGWGTYRASAYGTADFYRKQEAEKALEKWKRNPKVKEWEESLSKSITFDGQRLDDIAEKLKPQIQEGSPQESREAFAKSYVFEQLAGNAKNRDFEKTPAELARSIIDNNEFWGMDAETRQAALSVAQDIADGKINVVLPYRGDPYSSVTEGGFYYKNKGNFDTTLTTTGEWPVMYEIRNLVVSILGKDKKISSEEFAKRFKKAYEVALADAKEIKEESGYWNDVYKALSSVDPDAVVYNPLPEPPIPQPKGAMARVLSVRPEEEYYVLDLPLNEQTAYIQNAVDGLLKTGSTAAGTKRLRDILTADMSASGRVAQIEDLLSKGRKAGDYRSPKDVSMMLRSFGIAGYKYVDGATRGKPINEKTRFNYVDFYDKDEGPAIVAWDIDRVGPAEGTLFSRNLPTAARVADSLIAKEKGWLTKLKENFLGMGARTQFVDKLAPTEEALKRGGTDPTKALQAMYYLRMYDQRMHFTSQSITDGVPELVEKTRRDGKTERIIETKPGANIQQIVNILKAKDVVKAAGSADAANKLFTLYLAAIRGDRVGYSTLNFGRVWAEAEVKRIESQLKSTTLSQEQRSVLQKRKKDLADKIPTMPTEADIKAARAEIEADPTLKKAFDEARDIYNQYNRNLLEFSVQTGALSRDEANKYLRNNDYIPYYRMRDGVAELMIGNETPIRIGNLKDSPHLKELVGGDEAIFDFLTSSVQNTSMLLDMATKNLATKNLMFELRDVGLATVAKVPKSGKTPEGAVTFKRDGEDYFAVVDTDTLGIDSDLLVKGLAGIPTMFPAFIRVLGIPARILRRVVVASPVYMARQLFRDSLAATLSSGANTVPVLSSLQQIGKPKALQGRGITGGQVFTGMPEDVTRMLKDMQAGKISVTNGFAWLEAKSAQVDALTREAQYASYREQGLSEMEATLMALESMNFSKRGLSPTMHMASTLIPFFNAQIQGLDVLYKAFTGQMPLNERLAIREKLWTRGLMLAGLSMAYAVAMQDDETYKNAKPEEKYGNWFVPVPGFEQMVRLPIPFELGYIFKALPEAMVNIVMNEKGGEEAAKALTHIVRQTIPGGSSYMIPQAVKPALEALAFEKSLFTGRSIESAREQMMEPGLRYRDSTTALAREVGELTGFSPIKMEFLISGYFGTMGMALLAALSAPFGKEGPESATKRASDMPVVGTLFQPNDASGIIDATYERMKRINEVKETYEGLIEKGRVADATKYLNENASEMALASVAGSFKQIMGDITKYEREVRASSLSPEEKRQKLDDARQMKIRIASSVRAMAGKKEPQAALP